jgi:hypothetical protein
MTFTPYGAAPGRECGACTMCCKVYTFPEIGKPAGVWCRYCTPGKGCKIHDNVPDPCRQFFCLWMTDGTMPAEWRPDRARFVLTVYPGNGFVYGQVDPGSPGAWRRAPYYDALRSMAKRLADERRLLVMFVGDEATLLTPDEAVPLGRMTPEDDFKIEQISGPTGSTWRVAKAPKAKAPKDEAPAADGTLDASSRPHYFGPPET